MEEKYYVIAVKEAKEFASIHNSLINGTLLGRKIICDDYMKHSPCRGEFLLTENEAHALLNNDKIKFVNLSSNKYPELYFIKSEDVTCDITSENYDRYDSAVWNHNQWYFDVETKFQASNILPEENYEEKYRITNQFRRASAQLIRLEQKRNPWIESNTDIQEPIFRNPKPHGAGEHVDIVIMDNGVWFGHTEFINPHRVDLISHTVAGIDIENIGVAHSPEDYVGGNVLPGNGYCDVLDIILDGPYYIDPEWFDADPDNRLETRWDGTIVPVEHVARDWWLYSDQRSEKFADIGNVPVSDTVTRAGVNGSNTAGPTYANAGHGTPCASLAYGRTHGWAYNANKWQIVAFDNGGPGSESRVYDILKIFHQYKPINPLYGRQDPTIGSNSWGYRGWLAPELKYYHYQGQTVDIQNYVPNSINELGTVYDSNRFKSERYDDQDTEAGKELVDSGFIWMTAAGNSSQTQVNPDDPNYDNHLSVNSSDNLYDDNYFGSSGSPFTPTFGQQRYTRTTHRRGWPQHIGKTEEKTFANNTTVKYPGLNIGALEPSLSDDGRERIASYSDRGNAVDLFVTAHGTIAANGTNYSQGIVAAAQLGMPRYDNSYAGSTLISNDKSFSGTSAACPVAAGFLATVLQYNRDWSSYDLRRWIKEELETQDASDFYDNDTPPVGVDDEVWNDRFALNGADAKVLYSDNIPMTTPHPDVKNESKIVSGGLKMSGGLILKGS